jgi:hypothetical protein
MNLSARTVIEGELQAVTAGMGEICSWKLVGSDNPQASLYCCMDFADASS